MAKKQPQQNNDDSEINKSQDSHASQESAQNEQNEILDNEDLCDNMEIPFEDYRKSFSVFNNRNKPENLKSYVKIKTQSELDELKTCLSMLFQKTQKEDNTTNEQLTKKISKNPQQFFAQCKVPPNTTIFIHIFLVDSKRCNIKITNAFGYVLAYLTDIMSSRKFYKLYKLLAKIGKNSLLVIFDEYESVWKEASFIKKIADYAQHFCYYNTLRDEKFPPKFTSFNLQQQKLVPLKASKKQKPTFIWIKNRIFWYFSQIFTKNQDVQILLTQMKSLQQKIQNPVILRELKEIKDGSMDFVIKSIFINLSKYKKVQTASQVLQCLRGMIQGPQAALKEKTQPQFGNPLYHFPESLKASKQCVHCNQNNKQMMEYIDPQQIKKSKTKYRCQGCSAQAQKDISLCLDCFAPYHIKKREAKRKAQKKAKYLKALKQKKKLQKFQILHKHLHNNHPLRNVYITQMKSNIPQFLKINNKPQFPKINNIKSDKPQFPKINNIKSDKPQFPKIKLRHLSKRKKSKLRKNDLFKIIQCVKQEQMSDYEDNKKCPQVPTTIAHNNKSINNNDNIIVNSSNNNKKINNNGNINRNINFNNNNSSINNIYNFNNNKNVNNNINFNSNNSNNINTQMMNFIDEMSDQEDEHIQVGTREKLRQLQQNKRYRMTLDKLDKQKHNFFNMFTQLLKDKSTKYIAIRVAEYLKFKAITILNH